MTVFGIIPWIIALFSKEGPPSSSDDPEPERLCLPIYENCATSSYPTCCDGLICTFGDNASANNSNVTTATSPLFQCLPRAPASRHWLGPFDLPIDPAAAANLPDGRVVLWSAFKKDNSYGDPGTDQTWTTIFDPETLVATESLISNTKHDMFCPGTAVLPNGEVMVTGGSTDGAVSIYDPVAEEWRKGPDMQIGRGYHSMTMLRDGGKGGKDGELWKEGKDGNGLWSVTPGITVETDGSLVTKDIDGVYRADNHMWLFEAPNGKIFQAGPSSQMHWIDLEAGGTLTESIVRGPDAMNGNAVMYDIGKILTLGGAADYGDYDCPTCVEATNKAYVLDINDGDNVSVEPTGSLRYPRTYVNSVVLPSGEVVAIGGLNHAEIFIEAGAVLEAEIWNPATGEWTEIGSMTNARAYHSATILLKDGRVLVAGGGTCGEWCGDVNHFDAEILIPPYLRDNDGSLIMVRPIIQSAPTKITFGETFVVEMDTAGDHTFSLLRLGATTHSINNDQRRIPLPVVNEGNGSFTLTVPSEDAVALPGAYFLFAINADGVPSVASTVSIPQPATAFLFSSDAGSSVEELETTSFSDFSFLSPIGAKVTRVGLREIRDLKYLKLPGVDRIALTLATGESLVHGSPSSGGESELYLESGEYLTSLSFCRPWLNLSFLNYFKYPKITFIKVSTSLGRSVQVGRDTRDCKTISAPDDMAIVGFYGREFEDQFYRLGAIFGPILP